MLTMICMLWWWLWVGSSRRYNERRTSNSTNNGYHQNHSPLVICVLNFFSEPCRTFSISFKWTFQLSLATIFFLIQYLLHASSCRCSPTTAWLLIWYIFWEESLDSLSQYQALYFKSCPQYVHCCPNVVVIESLFAVQSSRIVMVLIQKKTSFCLYRVFMSGTN